MPFSISVRNDDFNVAQEYSELVAEDTSAGAVVFFVGRVRDFNDGASVTGLSLEHYPEMTEKILQEILDEARERWQLLAARIVHRIGNLQSGDQIVFVGTTSVHREQAFQAAEFLMDFLKTKAPFWKKEINAGGESKWVAAAGKDIEKAKRWNEAGS